MEMSVTNLLVGLKHVLLARNAALNSDVALNYKYWFA